MQDVIHQLFSESLMDEFTLFDSSIDEKQIDSILTKLELIKIKNRHPMCLSGGQMQRLAVAVGMLMNREIIILDEPTSGLDYLNMMQISEVIKEFSKNKIVFIVTHDKEPVSYTHLPFAMKGDKNMDYKAMRNQIEDMVNDNHKDFVKAIISMEKGINDESALDKLYDAYMDNDSLNLLHEEFDYMIEDLREQGQIKDLPYCLLYTSQYQSLERG